jgi:hypothetical protein
VVDHLACYSTLQKASNGIAVRHLGRYLLGMGDKGVILFTLMPLEINCNVNADFCVTWYKKYSKNDPDIALSQSRVKASSHDITLHSLK